MKALLNERMRLMKEIDAHLLEIGAAYQQIRSMTKALAKELHGTRKTLPEGMTDEKLNFAMRDAFNAALSGKLGDEQQALRVAAGVLGEVMNTSFLSDQEAKTQKILLEV